MNSIKYFYIAIAILFSSENSFSKDVIINQNNTGHINLSECISYTVEYQSL